MPTGLGGEIGWWCPSLDDSGNGTTTLYDLSGNGNDGAFAGGLTTGAWTADTGDGGVRALALTGGGYVNVPSFVPSSMASGSLCFWAKFSGSQTHAAARVVSFGNDNNDSIQPYVKSDIDIWVYGRKSGVTQFQDGTTSGGMNNGVWRPVVVTWTTNDARIYIDGVLIAQDTSCSISLATGGRLCIGEICDVLYVRPFTGSIDDVRVFDRAIAGHERDYFASQRAAAGEAPFNPYPVIESYKVNQTSSASTNFSTYYPSGILDGELLLWLCNHNDDVGLPGLTGLEAWTLLYEHNAYLNMSPRCYYKVADGTETGTLTITASAAPSKSSRIMLRISGASGRVAVSSSGSAIGTWNAPSLTPAWGSKYYLWLAECSSRSNWRASYGVPTGYASNGYNTQESSSYIGLWAYEKTAVGASENPASASCAGNYTQARTIAIEPAIRGLLKKTKHHRAGRLSL